MRWVLAVLLSAVSQAELLAGAAKVDVTDYDAGPANDPLYVKALVLREGETTLTIITVDAVAIGEIGHIGNDYLPEVRARLRDQLHLPAEQVLVNASHCHGVVRKDIGEKTVEAARLALERLTPVQVAAGTGHEDRISENRRFKLKDGSEADSRHAYPLPPDAEIAEVGPIDPEIGVLRLDKSDGGTLAMLYNFACHPIQGVPSKGNTADLTGFASQVMEDNAGEGAVALFLQGCGGDINPIGYKAVDQPRDAEVLGNRLGLRTLKAMRGLQPAPEAQLKVLREVVELPRANSAQRIQELEAEQQRLLESLRGTSLNFKTFLPLLIKYSLSEEFPSYYAHQYLHEEQVGRGDLRQLDAENRANLDAYLQNILTMERLTRLQTNLALLRKHQADNSQAEKDTVEAEVLAVRIGDLALVTFPAELTVETGLEIKRRSPHPLTFVAGYTNGYLYYAPTPEQAANAGGAQEDSDCLLSPEWHPVFVEKALELLGRL